ncbi:MAG: glycosyltransferase family 39 protein [Candidatus Zipacnadales bacterium]
MSMTTPRALAAGSIILYLVITLIYTFGTPPLSGPDADLHLEYIDILVDHHRLPRMPQGGHGAHASWECPQAQHPPLYYVALAPLRAATRGLGAETSLLCLRLLSVVSGLSVLGLIWLSARCVWPQDEWRPAVAVALSATLPQTQYMSSTINNSVAALLLWALVVLCGVRILCRESWRWRDWLSLGLSFAALTSVKLTGMAALGLVGACAWLKLKDPGLRWGQRLKSIALLVVPTLVCLGPWLVRNQLLYGTATPRRVVGRSINELGFITILLRPEDAIAALTMAAPQFAPTLMAPYWLLWPYHPGRNIHPLLAAVPVVMALGMVLAGIRRLNARYAHPWGARDAVFLGLLASVGLMALGLVGMTISDWYIANCAGRYAWEMLSGLAVLGTLAYFAYPAPCLRTTLLIACLTIQVVASVVILREVLIILAGGVP